MTSAAETANRRNATSLAKLDISLMNRPHNVSTTLWAMRVALPILTSATGDRTLERRRIGTGQVSHVACRSCSAPVLLDPATMTVSAFGVVLRCAACDAMVPVRRYDPERGTSARGEEGSDSGAQRQWKLADALGLDRDNETPSPTRALLLSFPGFRTAS
jgi:hypothetical protein